MKKTLGLVLLTLTVGASAHAGTTVWDCAETNEAGQLQADGRTYIIEVKRGLFSGGLKLITQYWTENDRQKAEVGTEFNPKEMTYKDGAYHAESSWTIILAGGTRYLTMEPAIVNGGADQARVVYSSRGDNLIGTAPSSYTWPALCTVRN